MMRAPNGGVAAQRMAVLATAALMAITAAACGSDDEPGPSAELEKDIAAMLAAETGAAGPPKRSGGAEEVSWARANELSARDDATTSSKATGDVAEIAETLQDVQISLAAGSGLSVCHELSDEGQLAVAQSIGGRDLQACKDVVQRVSEERRRAGGYTDVAEVLSVKVRGGQATARARYPDGSVRYIAFVRKEDLSWRVTSLDLVDDEVVQNEPEGPGHDFADPRDVGPAAQIKETLYDVQGDFPRGLGNSVCSELTPTGRREVEKSGIGGGGCEQRIPAISERALAAGFQPRFSQVLSVRIQGSRAAAIVRDSGGKPYSVPFVKTNQGWKLPSVRWAGTVDLGMLR